MDKTIRKLYIEPTSACNLKCSMCFRHNWIDEKQGFMTDDTFKNILESVGCVESVMFGGMGEPLLHKNISEMIREFSDRNIKTELLTNATMLDKKMAESLINSGLDVLWISIDGFDKEEYENIHIGSKFDEIIDNIKYFNTIRENCQMGMTYVIMQENIEDVVKINSFADDLSFDYINLSYSVPSSPIEKENSCYDCGFLIGKQNRVDLSKFYLRKLNVCPFIEGENCFIKWNGDITPCMQLLHSSYTYFYEEKREVLYKSFGNVNDITLDEAWESGEYALFRDKVKKFEFPDCTICDGCDDRLKNAQDCMYNEFPTCGACLWAQGVGKCP